MKLGQVVATPGFLELAQREGISPIQLINRHVSGDWGDLCDEDKKANREALKVGARIMSSYKVNDKEKVWVITEADRSVTTLLLPSEY